METHQRIIAALQLVGLSIVVLGVMLSGTVWATGVVADGAGCNSNDTTAPCFANNPDILAGQRSLLPVDDLVLTKVLPATNGFETLLLETSDSTLDATITELSVTLGCEFASPVPWAVQTEIGRVWPLSNDVLVTLAPTNSATGTNCATDEDDFVLFVSDGVNSDNNSQTPVNASPEYAQIALADFDIDGLQEVFFINGETIKIFAPVNSGNAATGEAGDPAQGLVEQASAPISSDLTPIPGATAPVIGDFNGDGALDVAWAGAVPLFGPEIQIHFASVCPAAGAQVLGTSCTSAFQIIVSSQVIDLATTLTNTIDTPLPALTAGEFDGVLAADTGQGSAELLVAVPNLATNDVTVSVYSFDSDLVPTAGPNTLTWDGVSFPSAASGRLDWSERQEQAVVGVLNVESSGVQAPEVYVVTFDSSTLSMSSSSTSLGFQSAGFWVDVAVGRFDPSAVNGETDFDQQIAAAYQANNTNAGYVTVLTALLSVDLPTDPTPTVTFEGSAITNLQANMLDWVRQANLLQSGDAQGRSLTLGAPQKATVTAHVQPDTVLGMPPMHVDYIEPLGGTDPAVLNITVFPDSFNTVYDFADTTGTQATRQNTTSYTYATTESATEEISYGIPDLDSISITATEAASQTYQNAVSDTYNTYTNDSYQFQTATVFDDEVAATSRQMNVYTYPVIGRTACPENSEQTGNSGDQCCPSTDVSNGSCTNTDNLLDQLPLVVQFSGPDNVVHLDAAVARGLEWYQPVNEPGSVFSFAGNQSQLESDVPAQAGTSTSRFQLLSEAETEWGTQSTEQVSVEWSAGGGSDVTSGSVSTHSFDASVSVSGHVSLDLFGAGGSVGFDYNKSTAISTLNASTSTFGDSTGITVNRGIDPDGPTSNEDFLYAGRTYIYGQDAPTGIQQTDIAPDTTVQAAGYIRVGYVADPVSVGTVTSGDWWLQAYGSTPDVALNHPQRWLQQLPTSQNEEQVAFNCPIGFASSFTDPECTPNSETPTPLSVADRPFYQMKGLFVTPGASTTGPTAVSATLGDTVTLKARIYNYSLANMVDDTEVHVQFYAQPWDDSTGQFLAEVGNPDAFAPAVFIGEQVLDPIPAFCGGEASSTFDPCTEEDAPRNFVLASVPWDTSQISPQPVADTYWAFWLVVWMEVGGELAPEITGHGLSAIPGSNLNSLADVPLETYSNNLGFYNQIFSLNLPTSATSAGGFTASLSPASFAAAREEPTLTVDTVTVSPAVPLRNRGSTVRASLVTNSATLDAVLTQFYDGEPDANGRLFDQEFVPRIQESTPFVTRALWVPETCGAHTMAIEAVPADGSAAPATRSAIVTVTTDPVDDIGVLLQSIDRLDLPPRFAHGLRTTLKRAQKAFEKGREANGIRRLEHFTEIVEAKSGVKIPPETSGTLVEEVQSIIDCL